MSTLKKIFRALAAILAVLVVLAALSPLLIYAYGLRLIPDQALADPPQILPATATTAHWASLGGVGTPRIERDNPYAFIWRMWKHRPFAPSAAEQAASLAARTRLLPRAERFRMWQWHLAGVSAAIWVSRHWTAEQILSAYPGEAYFGHRFYGLEAAAQGYFGLPSVKLNPRQMAHLIAVVRSPARFDPWCHPDRNRERADWIMSRLPQTPRDTPINLLPAPAGACSE